MALVLELINLLENKKDEYNTVADYINSNLPKSLKPYAKAYERDILGATLNFDIIGLGREARGTDYHNSRVASMMMQSDDNYFKTLTSHFRDIGIKAPMKRKQPTSMDGAKKLLDWIKKNEKSIVQYIDDTWGKRENSNPYIGLDHGLSSGETISDKDGKLLPDPGVDTIDNINFKDIEKGPDANEKEFDKKIHDKELGKDKEKTESNLLTFSNWNESFTVKIKDGETDINKLARIKP